MHALAGAALFSGMSYAARKGLAHYLHPIFGMTAFNVPISFFLGGSLTAFYGSAAEEQRALGTVAQNLTSHP